MALTYTNLRDHVSEFAGFGATYAAAGANAQAQIDRAVESGLRDFYRPGRVDSNDQHYWSFLRTTKDVVIAADATSTAYETASDEDDTVIIGNGIITAPAGRSGGGVELLVFQRIQTLIARDDATGTPRHACVISGNLLSWPKADQEYTVRFEVVLMPGVTATDTLYGASEHGETMIYACRAAYERMYNDGGDQQNANHYAARLAQSIANDREAVTAETFSSMNRAWGRDGSRYTRRRDNGATYVPPVWG